VNHKRVERLMRNNGIVGVHEPAKVRTTIPAEDDPPMPDEADDRGGVGEDGHDVGASFQFAVEAFDRVVRPDLGPVRVRESGVGEEVGFHSFEQRGDFGCERLELADNET